MKNARATCSRCTARAKHSGIVGGVFGKYCDKHFNIRRIESSQHARYKREQDRAQHEGDLVQPWKNGKPNAEFAELYPDQAKKTYTKDELKNLERDY